MTQPVAETVAGRQVAQAWYQRQQALARRAALAVQAWWLRLNAFDLTSSWGQIGQPMTATVAAGQLFAATGADQFVADMLLAQGITGPVGTTDTRAFAGIASNGTPLDTLLQQAMIGVKQDIGTGLPVDTAMRRGQVAAVRIATTQVQDAGRIATSVAAMQRRQVTHYIRVLTAPSCSRCVLLAGTVWHVTDAFLRHPNCDCINVPVTDPAAADDYRINPRSYFESLSASEQAKTFTAAGAQAIRDGADIYQVVNARAGMQTTLIGRGANPERVLTTTAGVTTKLLRARLGSTKIPRLMPEQIYKDAHGNRDVALELLYRFGYIR